MRRVGVEARPDLVQGASKDSGGGSSSEQNERKDDSDDPPNGDSDEPRNNDDEPQTENADNSENLSTEDQPPLIPENTSTTHQENQVLLSAEFCATGFGCLVASISHAYTKEQHHTKLATTFLHLAGDYICRDMLSLYLVMLYINSEYSWKLRQRI